MNVRFSAASCMLVAASPPERMPTNFGFSMNLEPVCDTNMGVGIAVVSIVVSCVVILQCGWQALCV